MTFLIQNEIHLKSIRVSKYLFIDETRAVEKKSEKLDATDAGIYPVCNDDF